MKKEPTSPRTKTRPGRRGREKKLKIGDKVIAGGKVWQVTRATENYGGSVGRVFFGRRVYAYPGNRFAADGLPMAVPADSAERFTRSALPCSWQISGGDARTPVVLSIDGQPLDPKDPRFLGVYDHLLEEE